MRCHGASDLGTAFKLSLADDSRVRLGRKCGAAAGAITSGDTDDEDVEADDEEIEGYIKLKHNREP